MTVNDIKKALYKQNPKADLLYVDGDGVRLQTEIELEDGTKRLLVFIVPLKDVIGGTFAKNMEAKYLARWLAID